MVFLALKSLACARPQLLRNNITPAPSVGLRLMDEVMSSNVRRKKIAFIR